MMLARLLCYVGWHCFHPTGHGTPIEVRRGLLCLRVYEEYAEVIKCCWCSKEIARRYKRWLV